MDKYKIFIGWDSHEPLAYDVAKFSILRQAKEPKKMQIIPLQLGQNVPMLNRPTILKDGLTWCPISDAPVSTEFSNSRFCVPFLTKGWALFVDCDIVAKADLAELFALRDDKYAVMVVKNKHTDGASTHMVDKPQLYYSRKNWSSVILWNCDHPANKGLTLTALNTWPGRDLHAFKWLAEDEIGELPQAWNYLVGVNPPSNEPLKILHYTLGGPWLEGWEPNPLDEDWNNEYKLFKPNVSS